jgi:hypothetical protein
MSDDIIVIEGASLTLTLESVPVSMAGAAGGALQTAQRIGAAIGTAVLATISCQVLTDTGHDYPVAASETLLCATGLMLLALLMAVAEFVRRRPAGPHRLRGRSHRARRPAVHCGHHRPGSVGGQDRRPVDHCVEDRSLGVDPEIVAR